MEKVVEIQKQIRDNAKTLNTYLTDLQSWEKEMKRKEAALNGEFEQDLPPVRSKAKKEKPVIVQKKKEKPIKSFDYQSWDKYDVDKACEDVDMAEVGPLSLDSKKSTAAKMDKFREEAQYQKERGNIFVKQEKWDEAIACYNRAIELVKDDAIYFANRGLCYLKKDSLHQAESDCTEAVRLDPTYVKALQRRASARERLGSLRAASADLAEVLKLEPQNNAAKRQLDAVKQRMGTKGSKSKSSPQSTPTQESKPLIHITKPPETCKTPKIVELKDEPVKQPAKVEPPKVPSALEKWRNGEGQGIMVIRPVKKPPHLRSKRALRPIPIQEIQIGKTSPERPATRLKIIDIDDNAHGDSNNNEAVAQNTPEIDNNGDKSAADDSKNKKLTADSSKDNKSSPESDKLIADSLVSEKLEKVCVKNLVPPMNSVQFMAEWKYLKGKGDARSDYLSIIDPLKIPSIFENALESDVLSDVLCILTQHTEKFQQKTVVAYLKGLCSVKRFSALAMFLTASDKEMLTKLLQHCKTVENCTEEDIADLKNKFEL